jgi:hypothetical protein
MKIRMLTTERGSVDGVLVTAYEADQEYDLTATAGARDLAKAFVGAGLAVEVGADYVPTKAELMEAHERLAQIRAELDAERERLHTQASEQSVERERLTELAERLAARQVASKGAPPAPEPGADAASITESATDTKPARAARAK